MEKNVTHNAFDLPSYLKGEQWLLEAVIGILILVLINLTLKHVIKYLRRRFLSLTQDWKEKLDFIVYIPIRIMLWIFGVVFVLDLVWQRFKLSQATLVYLNMARNVALVGCFTWLLLRFTREMHHSFVARHRKKKLDPAMIHIFSRLLTLAIVIIACLIILQMVGLNIVPLLAFGGIGAAAIGFAAKDVIGNFFGGFMLYMTRPFMVGDWVLLPAQNVEGSIEEIGWYTTTIRDKDKRPLYMPNAVFSNQLVINSSRMSHRRVLDTIGISYADGDKLEKVIAEIKREIASHPTIDANLPILVNFSKFNNSSLDISYDAYTLATRYDEFIKVKEDILFRIQKVINEQGVTIPFQTITIDESLKR